MPICAHCAHSGFHHCEPVYKALPGWEETLDEVAEVSELPSGARAYNEFVEEQLGV